MTGGKGQVQPKTFYDLERESTDLIPKGSVCIAHDSPRWKPYDEFQRKKWVCFEDYQARQTEIEKGLAELQKGLDKQPVIRITEHAGKIAYDDIADAVKNLHELQKWIDIFQKSFSVFVEEVAKKETKK